MVKMGVELDKKYAIIAMKACYIAMRACYGSASKHPRVVVIIIFTIWFYRSFPRLFSFLVYASPIIVSTAVLLGALLLFGHQQVPKTRKQEKPYHHEIHYPQTRVVEDAEYTEKDVRSKPQEHVFEKKIAVVNNVNPNDDHRKEQYHSRRSSIDSNLSMANKKLIEEAKRQVCNNIKNNDLGEENIVMVNRGTQFQPSMANDTVENKEWETRNSSTTASMAGTIPMDDNLPPLMQPEVPHSHMSQFHVSGQEVPHHAHTDAVSNRSLKLGDHDDDDHHENEEGEVNVNEREEETVSTWTEDDHKNLKNMGKSEVERAQHMENLIARQKALSSMRKQAEENLEDIHQDISYRVGSNSTTRRNSIDHTRRSSIDLTRRSSIDLSYDVNENNLEATPSVTMPTTNPYVLPYDPRVEKSYPVAVGSNSTTRRNSIDLTRRDSIDLPYDNPYVLPYDPRVEKSYPVAVGSNATSRRNSIDLTRRHSLDPPYDINEMIPTTNPYVLPYDPRVEKSYPVAVGSNSTTRRNFIDLPNDNPYVLPYDPRVEKSYPVAVDLQSESSSFQPHDQFSNHHESFEMGPSPLLEPRQNEGYYTHEVSEHVSQRRRSSVDYNMAKLHYVGEGDGGLHEVKTSHAGQAGYQVQSRRESSSTSAFSDVTDHIDDEEEGDFRSADMPSTPEKDQQMQEKQKENDHMIQQGLKSIRVTSWFKWKQY